MAEGSLAIGTKRNDTHSTKICHLVGTDLSIRTLRSSILLCRLNNMQPQNLGRLKKIPVRQIWLNEAQDFSPWLAREENFQLLGEVLGLELELEAQEKNVGPFRADLLFRETLEGSFVLVENQLERTDHTHLGQLLTYAAGLKTVTIVWIAVQFTEEHQATLDWLNGITGEQFRFFGLELEL